MGVVGSRGTDQPKRRQEAKRLSKSTTMGSECPEVPPLVLGEPSIPYKALFITWLVGEGTLARCHPTAWTVVESEMRSC